MATGKKTAPEGAAVRECSRQAYENWKAGLADKGKTPTDAVEHYRSMGMKDYANDLAAVIEKKEGYNAAHSAKSNDLCGK